MKKRGSTITNFVLLIGMLLVSSAVIANINRILFWQAGQTQSDILSASATSLAATVRDSSASAGERIQNLTLSKTEGMGLEVKGKEMILINTLLGSNASQSLRDLDLNVIPSVVERNTIATMVMRRNSLLITDDLSCNLSDDACSPGCLAAGACDRMCYSTFADSYCFPDCADSNNDSQFGAQDRDGLCDPDCYDAERDGGVYDYDCLASNDSICDPDTHLVNDSYCDLDCLPLNGICDIDCSGYDTDCPPKHNGICELAKGESCTDSDCECKAFQVCKPNCGYFFSNNMVDDRGCTDMDNQKESNEICGNGCECTEGLNCIQSFEEQSVRACCKPGEYFNLTMEKCENYVNDGRCFNFTPFFESCSTSPKDCCHCYSDEGIAYLHGDAWAWWFNFRVPCDYQHKNLWRCEETDPGECQGPQDAYDQCINDLWNNHDDCSWPERFRGLRVPEEYCIDKFGKDPGRIWNGPSSCYDRADPCIYQADPGECGLDTYYGADADYTCPGGGGFNCRVASDTRKCDYDHLYGKIYGTHWGNMENIFRRVMQFYVMNPDGTKGDELLGGTRSVNGFAKDNSFTFACVPVQVGEERDLIIGVELGEWQVHQFVVHMRPGFHYVLNATGIAELEDCSGPPPALATFYPEAECSTKS